MTTAIRPAATSQIVINAVITWMTAFFERLGRGLDSIAEIGARSGEISRLMSLGDVDLARMGLTRDRIVAHVFRDQFPAASASEPKAD